MESPKPRVTERESPHVQKTLIKTKKTKTYLWVSSSISQETPWWLWWGELLCTVHIHTYIHIHELCCEQAQWHSNTHCNNHESWLSKREQPAFILMHQPDSAVMVPRQRRGCVQELTDLHMWLTLQAFWRWRMAFSAHLKWLRLNVMVMVMIIAQIWLLKKKNKNTEGLFEILLTGSATCLYSWADGP